MIRERGDCVYIESDFPYLFERVPSERIIADSGDERCLCSLFAEVRREVQRSSAEKRFPADDIEQNFPEGDHLQRTVDVFYDSHGLFPYQFRGYYTMLFLKKKTESRTL